MCRCCLLRFLYYWKRKVLREKCWRWRERLVLFERIAGDIKPKRDHDNNFLVGSSRLRLACMSRGKHARVIGKISAWTRAPHSSSFLRQPISCLFLTLFELAQLEKSEYLIDRNDVNASNLLRSSTSPTILSRLV